MSLKIELVDCVMDRKVDESYLKELGESYKAVGRWIQPVGLRQIGDRYKVIWGKCRVSAMKMAGITSLGDADYVIVNDGITDENLAFLENSVRKPMTLTEEISMIAEAGKGHSMAETARLIGKSEKWVRVRANLANLSEKWKEVLKEDNRDGWSIECLEQIAKYPNEVQDFYKGKFFSGRYYTPEKIIKEFEGGSHDLTEAVFDISDCQKCSKRNFGDLLDAGNGSKCLCAPCFRDKEIQELGNRFKNLQKENPEIFATDFGGQSYGSWDSAVKPYGKRYLEGYRLKSGGSMTAFCISGEKRGTVIKVSPKSKEDKEYIDKFLKELAPKSKEEVQKIKEEKKKIAEKNKAFIFACDEVIKMCQNLPVYVPGYYDIDDSTLFALILLFGVPDNFWLKRNHKLKHVDAEQVARQEILERMQYTMVLHLRECQDSENREFFNNICDFFGMKFSDFEKAYAADSKKKEGKKK